MLGLQNIQENKKSIIIGLKKRGFDSSKIVEEIINLDKKRRDTQTDLDIRLATSNKIAKEIGILYKTGETKKVSSLKEKSISLKSLTRKLQEQLIEIEKSLIDLRIQLPNVPYDIVPNGNSEKDNEEVFNSNLITESKVNYLPHWELGKKYDIIDFELGNKISGAGFPVYKDKGARLQRGLINYFLDKNISAGYKEVQVPILINESSGFGTGQLPDKEGQMYHVNKDNLYLIPTAEVPITNIYRNSLLDSKELPIALTGYTPCFRREAGSYGSHVRGLNRLHQFDKVEIVRIEEPKNALKALEHMVNHIKSILNELKLPYRILRLCAGDLGFSSALTYDFEIYSIGQSKWLEVSSVSTFDSFQAERLKLRYKNSKGKKELLHTLNGSSLALPRIVAGILENFQDSNGINLPEVLIPYTGFKKIQ
ncbi:serine--tRNA ligase [Flavobacteriaceae bacterium]|nr:serine--tRNA ligase [Flavobacteriaceae bacterium]